MPEMGRDQPHAEIGLGCAAEFCQSAWNQGLDLFGYSNNLLLAGAENYFKYNLNHSINWTPYYDCSNNNFYYPATMWGHRVPNNPQHEIIYNHYVVSKGLTAPYTQAMLRLRGIFDTRGEYSGYNALAFTLDASKSPFTALPVPEAPPSISAKAGISRVELNWNPPSGDLVSGYIILRSNKQDGLFSSLATLSYETTSNYVDTTVTNGTTYYYKVQSFNNAGVSGESSLVNATPVSGSSSMQDGWNLKDIGLTAATSSALYSAENNNSYVVKAGGSSFGGISDSHGFLYVNASGDFTITARLHDVKFSGSNADRVGLIMRETLNANSLMASVGLHDAGFRKVWFSRRITQGTNASWTNGNTHTWLPVWLRLQRVGNTITSFQSQDGVVWFTIASSDVDMNSTSYYVGLFSHSGSTSAAATTSAYFDNVTISGKVLGLVTSVTDNNFLEKELAIYPNPINSELTIIANRVGNYSVNVYSVTGKLLRSNSFTGNKQYVKFEDMPAGLYVVKINMGKYTSMRKVIKL